MAHLSHEKVLKYLNQARTDPKSLIPHLKKILSKFQGDKNYEIAPHSFMGTQEGKAVFYETIGFLEDQQPLHTLTNHKGLGKAAQGHAEDLGENNGMGHHGSNGSSMQQRIQRYCIHNQGKIGENVAQEIKQSNRDHEFEFIISLIVDDGVKTRGHRKAIFSPEYAFSGVGLGQTNDHYLVVINYAQCNLELKEGGENYETSKPKKVNITDIKDSTNKNNGNILIQKMMETGKGGRVVVGQSSSTSTKTVNGKTTTVKIVKIKYSDGSEETNESTTISS